MKSKNIVLDIIRYTFYFFPISFLIGSLAINFNSLIFVFFSLCYIIKKKIRLKFNFANKLLFSFFLIVILSSAINFKNIGLENLIKSVLLLRFFLIYILLEKLLIRKEIDLKIFFKICFFCTLFVSLDLILQFYSEKNVFGFAPHEGRITGVFGSEAIAGSFLQKLFLFALIGCFLISRKFKLNVIEILFFLIVVSGVFVSSNRMSFIIIICVLLFLSFFKLFRNKILIPMMLLVPFFVFLTLTNESIKIKLIDLQNKIIGSAQTLFDENKRNEVNFTITHGRIFYSSIQTFKQNPVIGSGLKSFRYKCLILEDKNKSCSTHPHNYHLEILNDTGIAGFFILLSFVLYILKKKIVYLKNKSIKSEYKIFLALLLLNFCIEIFPVKSTGSIFSTWTGTLVWLSVAVVNYDKKTNNS